MSPLRLCARWAAGSATSDSRKHPPCQPLETLIYEESMEGGGTMGALLNRAIAEQSLLDAWEAVRDSAYEDGEASAAVKAFEKRAAQRISEIGELIRWDKWSPDPVHAVSIPKSGGGVRRLGIPNVEDRIVERAVLGVLDPLIDPLLMPWSFGYRRGLGADDALRALVEARELGATWAVRADFEDCFDAVPRWPVVVRLQEVCDDAELVALVRRLVYRRVVGKDAPHASRKRGLHQGSPLSPLLANLYLDAFDRAMAERGWQVIRFADDFTIPVKSRADGERAIADGHECARAIDMELNLGKTTVVPFDQGVEFLGQTTTSTTGSGPLDSAHPLETTVFVDRQGALVRSKGDRLVVTDGDEVLARVAFRRVRQVVLFGRVGMTTPFIARALERGIDVIIAEESGGYIGRLSPLPRPAPQIRIAQYQRSVSPNSVVKLVRSIVTGKMQNQRVMLMRLDRRMEEPLLGPHIRRIDKRRDEASRAGALTALRGLEGAAARDYFQAFSQFLGGEWEWNGRVRRPPPDPVNAMLSFGYTLLAAEGVSACEAAGLDSAVGFLHQTHPGRPSMALDLIEEFRPIVVDAVVFALIGRRQVQPGDFERDEAGGCRMGDAARRAFLTAYEKRMLQLVTMPTERRRVSYRTAMFLQARNIAQAVQRDGEYTPVLWK